MKLEENVFDNKNEVVIYTKTEEETKKVGKEIAKLLKEKYPKIKTQIQGNSVRCSSNSKDELQSAISMLHDMDFDFPLNFVNYR